MTLTANQTKILELVKLFLESNEHSVFILRGYAGTGKTTIIKEIATHLEKEEYNFALMAPTGRAARILKEKTGFLSSTIHKGIYSGTGIKSNRPNNPNDIAETKIKFIYPIASPKKSPIVAIIDEASMLSSRKHEQELFSFGTDNLLEDLLTYTRLHSGGKLIFVGDPAQLPPVGETVSNALCAEYFEKLGFKIIEAELTEVLRQGAESSILRNATMLRKVLQAEKRNYLEFEMKEGEVESLPIGSLLDTYTAGWKATIPSNSILICYSNKVANDYNHDIRCELYGEDSPLRVGDILQVTQNNYLSNRMNGEFIPVLDIGLREQHIVPVWIEKSGRKERVKLTLNFIQICTLDGDDNPIKSMLLEDLLTSSHSSLSVDEVRALYIDFCIRRPSLKEGTAEFHDELKTDPYFNALRCKYGYAVTGHKSQGGEWDTVFVDYTGRSGLSEESLRWAYTVTTRARVKLYITNLPKITPFSAFRIEPIQKCKHIDEEFRIIASVGATPFHQISAQAYLRAKYFCIKSNMSASPYKIHHIESKPYLEIYKIQAPTGVHRFDILYKAGGIFLPAKAYEKNQDTQAILTLLNEESQMPIVFDYTPSDDIHGQLYHIICSACDSLSIQITNVVEHKEDYSTIYYMRTCGSFSYMKVYINANGFITYAKPMSLLGEEDYQLKAVIEEIKTHMK